MKGKATTKAGKAGVKADTKGAKVTKSVEKKNKAVPEEMTADFEHLPSSDEEEEDEEEEAEEEYDGFESTDDEEVEEKKEKTSKGTVDEEKIKETIQKTKNNKKKDDKEDKPGVVYVGRIPHGFYEQQMRSYFNQFGDITRLRLSRNKKTGRSKHYAFIEFSSREVAKIVAESMNNYLLFGHILKVQLLEPSQVHDNLFVGANKAFKPVPWTRIARVNNDKQKPKAALEDLQSKHEKRLKEKNDNLAKLGINYSYDISSPKKNPTPKKKKKTSKK